MYVFEWVTFRYCMNYPCNSIFLTVLWYFWGVGACEQRWTKPLHIKVKPQSPWYLQAIQFLQEIAKKCGPSTQGASQSGAAMTFPCTGSLPRLVQVFKRRNAKYEGFLASSEAKMCSVGVFDARTIMLLQPWTDYAVVFIKRAYCVRKKGGRELGRRVTLIPELSGWQRLTLWFLHPPVPLRLNFICMRLCGAARVLHTPVSSPLDYLLEICVGGLRIFPAYCSAPQRKVSSC